MRGKNDVYVLEVGGKYRVRPAVWSGDGSANQRMTFRNMTSKPIIVVVPAAVTNNNTDALLPIDSGKVDGFNLKNVQAGQPALMSPYSVLVKTSTGFEPAQGESDPIIIIDP
jgi:hypothetical protein